MTNQGSSHAQAAAVTDAARPPRGPAIAVHVYTATGSVLAFLMVVAAVQERSVRRCGSSSSP